MAVPPSRFGAFIAPHHDPRIDATLQIRRDDEFMLGIDPAEQRDMMIESAEVIVELLAGNKVTRTTSWFDLREAHLQLLPHNPAGLEIAVASVVSPTGAILAGRLGLGMLSLAATDPRGFS